MRTLTVGSDVEIIGGTMASIIENVRSEHIQPFLEKQDLTDIDKEAWYPAEKWIAVMNDLGSDAGSMGDFVAIGMKVAENVVFPPQLQGAPLGKIFEMWDVVYKKQHRGGNIGGRVVEQISETSYRVTLTDLYPDDMSYGVAYGWCKRFLPAGTNFKVSYEDMAKTRDKGDGDETVLLIEWD